MTLDNAARGPRCPRTHRQRAPFSPAIIDGPRSSTGMVPLLGQRDRGVPVSDRRPLDLRHRSALLR